MPIRKSTTPGPGTFDSTATIVRSRILIWTFVLFFGFDVATWRAASATMPPTHSPGGVPAGTCTVNPTWRCAPGASVTEVESSVIHEPARVGVLLVSYTVPVVRPVVASVGKSLTVPLAVPAFETITAPVPAVPAASGKMK